MVYDYFVVSLFINPRVHERITKKGKKVALIVRVPD